LKNIITIPSPWKTEKIDPIDCDQMSQKSHAKSRMLHMGSAIPVATQHEDNKYSMK
jgi:hypothetical protein